ncbi:hypothetical protein XENOCAPTIV_023611 [Xenoophorus captivus]|uniref:DEP domain-containing protein n=1 Tax=Xenoophorus captivus TaxID=1517983 RepID=A0ABV0RDA3_9TELE
MVKEDNFIAQIFTFTLLSVSLYSSFMWPGQCENCCESKDCLLAQMDELQQVADRQVVRHVLLCLLLIVFLLAVSKTPPFSLWLLYNHLHGRLYLELQYFSMFRAAVLQLKSLLPYRCGVRTMLDCFRGCELVDWLQQVGLAQDRGEAVLYGTRLEQGRVLQHIKQEYSFEDSQLHYYFTT